MTDWTSSLNPETAPDESPSLKLYLQARNEMEAGNLPVAIDLFRQSMEANPHSKSAELLGECLLKRDDFSLAIEALKAATALGGAARPPALLAEAYFRSGDTTNAEAAARESLLRNSNYGPALHLLGVITEGTAKS